jgi:hypothetical protein
MNEHLKFIQEEIALSILTNASQHNDYKRKALLDFIQASSREWLSGFADCERGEYKGESAAYSSGYWNCHHYLESASYVEGEYLDYE